jgi:hypothetical protein
MTWKQGVLYEYASIQREDGTLVFDDVQVLDDLISSILFDNLVAKRCCGGSKG